MWKVDICPTTALLIGVYSTHNKDCLTNMSISLCHMIYLLQLWMGTHKKGPSIISFPTQYNGKLLSEWISDNQWALGEEVARQFGGELPFLFKVLSINKSLSIQARACWKVACLCPE